MKTTEIKKILPSQFRQGMKKGSPLDAIVNVMANLHIKTEETLADLDRFFAPIRTDESFVPFLAQWVDLDWVYRINGTNSGPDRALISTDNVRELISLAWYLSKWRGSAKGLILFLETATGIDGFSVNDTPSDEDGRIIPFHMEITVPGSAASKRNLIERIIDNEKPAYVTYTLVITDGPPHEFMDES